MKSYTDLEQSKKLAEILPIESADMSYSFNFDSGIYEISTTSYKSWIVPKYAQPDDGFGQVIPCWSLAALLNALPSNLQLALAINDYQGDIKEWYAIGSVNSDIYDCYADNPIDACYEMIIGLHELKML